MRRGDLVFAYQAGKKGLVGLTRLASDGYRREGDGPTDAFDLASGKRLIFSHPVPFSSIRKLPDAFAKIEAIRIKRGTVFALDREGIDLLLRVITDANLPQREAILGFAESGAR